MGGVGSGKKASTASRRRKALKLRAGGWTLAQIGEELGCSPQAVSQLLGGDGRGSAEPLRCRACKRTICPPRKGVWTNRPALCLTCLAHAPNAPFGNRLQAFRLARGLTQRELAARTGVPRATIRNYEQTQSGRLAWPVLRKLVAFFGPGLVELEPPPESK